MSRLKVEVRPVTDGPVQVFFGFRQESRNKLALASNDKNRAMMQRSVPFGRGTVSLSSANPIGTGLLCVNCGSDATESMRKRSVPLSVHGLSGRIWTANLFERGSAN